MATWTNAVQCDTVSPVTLELAQCATVSPVTPELAQCAMVSPVTPEMAHCDMVSPVTPELAQCATVSPVTPELAQCDTVSPVTPELAQCDTVSLVTTELDQRHEVSLSWKTPYGVGAGLRNLGNTCYVNATLQCLTYTPPLANHMLALGLRLSCPGKRICMWCAIRCHITQALRHPGRVIQPSRALLADFHRENQEDAHEFLMFIVDAMQKVDLHSENRSLVREIFGGYWRSQIKCLQCGSTSDTFDPYLDIPLDIKSTRSVKQALARSVQPEELSGENAYHCSICLQKMPASKTLTLHTASKVLIILLKRFSDVTGKKIAKHVQYSECLDMQPYMSEQNNKPLLYTLYAVLVHAGFTSHSGHYFSYVRAGDGHWYKMNDNKVTACDRTSALIQDAYVLFYVQRSNLETDSSGMSADTKAKTLESEDKGLSANLRDLQIDSHREHINLEKTHIEGSTLDEWKFLQEQQQPKTKLNLRKVERNLPTNVVMTHRSKNTGKLKKTHPEQENFCPTNLARNITGRESTNTDQVPHVRGSARATKKKKNAQGKRPVLMV
nr:ubiquitin carboxyl-terminal hydrolase 17-like protein 6 [Cavia porcellus]